MIINGVVNTRSIGLTSQVHTSGETRPNIDMNAETVDINLATIQGGSQGSFTPSPWSPQLNALKIEYNRVIPYSTLQVQDNQVDSIRELLESRKLEGQINTSTSKKLYEIASLSEAHLDVMVNITERIDNEIEETEGLIASLEGLKETFEQIFLAFDKSEQVADVTELTKQIAENMGMDPINGSKVLQSSDYYDLIHSVTSLSKNYLRRAGTTQLYLQLLRDLDYALRVGTTPSLFTNSRWVPPAATTGPPRISRPWANAVHHVEPNIKRLDSIGIKSARNRDYLVNRNPYLRIPTLTTTDPIKKLMYYCTTLSREFLYSAGMGKLQGSSLGHKYAISSEDPMEESVIGARSVINIQNMSGPPNSLLSIATFLDDGNKPTTDDSGYGSRKRVFPLELDIPPNISVNSHRSTYEAWLNTVKLDPFNNKVSAYSQSLQAGSNTLDEMEGFFKEYLSREETPSLLTPRGLFTRVLKDFAYLLEGITIESDDGQRNNSLLELSILQLIGNSAPVEGRGDEADLRRGEISGMLRRVMTFFTSMEGLVSRGGYDDRDEEDQDGTLGPAESVGETDEGLVRMSGRDNQRRSGLLRHERTRKKNLADCLIMGGYQLPPGSDLPGYSKLSINGSRIIELLSSHGFGRSGRSFESVIVKIFEDLQREANDLAKSSGGDKSYLRVGGTTLHSGFDGPICISFLMSCFVELAVSLVDVFFVIGPETLFAASAMRGSWGNNEYDTEKPWQASAGVREEGFNTHDQHIYFKAGDQESSAMNQLRTFLAHLVAASESNDFSGLIDSENNLPGQPGVDGNFNLARGSQQAAGTVTPLSLIDAMEELALQDNAPVILFSTLKAIHNNLFDKSQTLIRKAAALRNEPTSQVETEEIEALRTISENPIASEFMSNLSNSQIELAKQRLTRIKNLPFDGSLLGNLPDSTYEVFKMFWDENQNEFSNASIIMAGLPNSSVEHSVRNHLDGLGPRPGFVGYRVRKTDDKFPGIVYRSRLYTFPVGVRVDEGSIEEAMSRDPKPQTISELVSFVRFVDKENPEGRTGEEIIANAAYPSGVADVYRNVVNSFLLKKMMLILTGTPADEADIQFETLNNRSSEVVSLVQTLMSPLSTSSETISEFFNTQVDGSNVSLPTTARYERLTQPQQSVLSGATVWNDPSLSSTEADTIYSLMSSKPTYVKKVQDMVLTTSVFDQVEALFIPMGGFSIDTGASNHYIRLSTHPVDRYTQTTDEEVIRRIAEARSPGQMSMPVLYIEANLRIDP